MMKVQIFLALFKSKLPSSLWNGVKKSKQQIELFMAYRHRKKEKSKSFKKISSLLSIILYTSKRLVLLRPVKERSSPTKSV